VSITSPNNQKKHHNMVLYKQILSIDSPNKQIENNILTHQTNPNKIKLNETKQN
jgi:hypothetical protein